MSVPKLSDHDVTSCSYCFDPIRWTVTAKGLPLAVDASPDETGKGNTAVYADGTGRLRSRGLTRERPTLEHAEWRAIPHIATCKNPPLKQRSLPAPRRRRTAVRPGPWRPR
ncbi:hypothetical protein ACFXCZ_27290 [Streptomyces sp. NPDC059396]|uniref:hypothetical protein n=1 Tax=Streptomyces sp. NPDC059396 TaxID=3346819 RepID=UPI0036B05615